MTKESKFINGLRYTDDETAEIVQMVLAGKVNKSYKRTLVVFVEKQSSDVCHKYQVLSPQSSGDRYDLELVEGMGVNAYDIDNKEYIDLSAGIGVNSLDYFFKRVYIAGGHVLKPIVEREKIIVIDVLSCR